MTVMEKIEEEIKAVLMRYNCHLEVEVVHGRYSEIAVCRIVHNDQDGFYKTLVDESSTFP